ncbi:MAG: P-II family nitrogen regulator [Ignavibacteriales bacterium]|nr:P-II family nitrogen regulator [Ignavibacteriales bacterium]
MKKVTAIVRRVLAREIVRAIEHAGCCCLSAVDIDGLGDMVDPEKEHISFEYEGYYTRMSRIEVLCRDEDIGSIVECIKSHGHTDHPGDGIVYVSCVERVARIQSGEEGDVTLRSQ